MRVARPAERMVEVEAGPVRLTVFGRISAADPTAYEWRGVHLQIGDIFLNLDQRCARREHDG